MPGRKITMLLGCHLSVLLPCALLISAAPVSPELDVASVLIASRTAQPQTLPQIAEYRQCSQLLPSIR